MFVICKHWIEYMEQFSQFLLYIHHICWLENKVWHLLYIVNILGITCSFLWISIAGCFCYLSRVYANVIHLYFLFSSNCCTKSALNQQIFISLIESTHDCNANILQKFFSIWPQLEPFRISWNVFVVKISPLFWHTIRLYIVFSDGSLLKRNRTCRRLIGAMM